MAKNPGHLRVLDQLTPPDLWPDIRGREPRRPPEEPRTRRALVAALALAIAAAAIAFAVRAFEVAERTPRPALTVENGLLAFSGAGQIHAVSPDGSGLQQLTHLGGHDALDVHWSPDGSMLAFRVWTKGDYELFVTNADGSGLTNVTGSMGVSEFAWSPNGSMLAFTAFQEGNDFDVFVVNADGTGLQAVVGSPLSEHRPQWSPDGTQIAFERWPVHDRDPGTPDIYSVALDRDEPVPVVTSSSWDTGAAWSPDGTRIAFSSERDGDEEIYVVNADGSGVQKLTELPGLDATTAAWSPDGTQISFVAHDGQQWDDWVVNADGSGLLKLTPSGRDDGPAVWAPDGSLLAFTASKVTGNVDNTGTYDVYTIRPDGTDERRITFGRLAVGWDLSWQPVRATVATTWPTETAPAAENARVTATIAVGFFSRDVAVGAGAVWVTVNDFIEGQPETHSLLRIDPATKEAVATIPVSSARHLAVWG
jgi:Tol biopolymer transport system component